MSSYKDTQLRLLGLTIAYYRRLKGLSQIELAEMVNCSRTHISNLEAPNGKKSVSLSVLIDISEALHVPLKDLFDFRNIEEIQPRM